jgi:adenylate cyclase
MKRAAWATFWIGLFAAAATIALQNFGLLHRPETLLDRSIFGEALPNENLTFWNYVVIVGIGFAVAWTVLQVPKSTRRSGLLLLLIAELICAAWVLSMAGTYFQPLPAVIVALLAACSATAIGFSEEGRRRRALTLLFSQRLAESGITSLTESKSRDLSKPATYEVSFVYCDVGNQAELIEEMPAADYAALMRNLKEQAAELFLKEGGYLHAADGEGIRVLFGFPNSLGTHAAVASRAVLAFRDRVANSLGRLELRVGISSGAIVALLPEEARRSEIVLSGEPLEIARRLALANQTYGSQILLDPRAFSSAGAEIVARPIDFLRSGEAHERLEVYELLALASEASAEELVCRDCFWTALVYFRERRWTEAFAEFNRARRADCDNDQPLQWYLRRLEPIILHMATEPAPVSDSLSPL